MKKKFAVTICAALLLITTAQANKLPYIPDRASAKAHAGLRTSIGNCQAGASQVDLYINDVRARLLDDGDKWWDLSVAHYIVPQVAAGQTPVSSIFAGSIWVGGIDPGGQLKIAAATYRQFGNDWFPGPIPQSGVVNEQLCSAFDAHWQVFGSQIDSFIAYVKGTLNDPGYTIPSTITMWPGAGNPNNPVVNYAPGVQLAPFFDNNNDGRYDPTLQNDDYPIIQQSVVCGCAKTEYADQMIWWCYNDIGNVHTETQGVPIGMQVNEEAWAYRTNDQINDMTFYHYRIMNDGVEPLDSTFMAQWVDPDLGWYDDDYVGCDVARGLGIDYNGTAVDGPGLPNYGDQPPLVGTTYFQGPNYQVPKTKGDTITRDTCLKMTSFIWYNNDFTAIGNPVGAQQYYGYMSGTWKDGTPFTFGGNGHGGSTPSKFMFPSDPPDKSSGAWSECESNDPPSDRRYLQASGPFVLQPGAVNDIVIGAVWVRPPVGTYPCPSFKTTIDIASDKAQALFDACFQLLDGPNAPDVTITELDRELVLNLVNTNSLLVEGYNQADPELKAAKIPDSTFAFQGYQIYQLINNQVTPQNYTNISQAKLVAQCDIQDGVGRIINYVFSSDLNGSVPTLMVQGTDKGIKHTFDITTDAFAQGSSQLINFQPYYFSVVSYAYNNYKDTTSTTVVSWDSVGITKSGADSFKRVVTTTLKIDSQPTPYLAGRKNIAIYTGIPHKPAPEAHGTQVNSYYGEGPSITREEGQGNGGNFLNLTQASIMGILNSPNNLLNHPTYEQGFGPIDVKVIDPKRVPADSFSLALKDTTYPNALNAVLNGSATKWILTDITTGDTVNSTQTIAVGNEQVLPQWGISIYINQVLGPGYNTQQDDGYISSEVDYADPKNPWLFGLVNQPPQSEFDWILSGTYDPQSTVHPGPSYANHDWVGADDDEFYEKVIGGTWAPYALCSYTPSLVPNTPIWTANLPSYNPWYPKSAGTYPTRRLTELNSVDVVFTNDQSKWSRCVVVEEQTNLTLAQGGAAKMGLRQHASWNGGIDANGNPIYSTTSGDIGMSYFPGYAINEETGQRLNIFFGEDSWEVSENGNDMLWDPTANQFSPVGAILLGGQHYIYVSSTPYDDCNAIDAALLSSTSNWPTVYSNIEWVGMTFLATGFTTLPLSQGLIPNGNTATVKIRVAKPYAEFASLADSAPVYNFGLRNLAADTSDLAMAKNALDSIEVVPNPYYAYSNYEQTALDNEIKFTNLPQTCTISIYTLNGDLVNTINYTGPYEEGKLNNLESTNWNLTNSHGVPVASGVYLIYFTAPNLGTRCIKWFGVRRPIDITNE